MAPASDTDTTCEPDKNFPWEKIFTKETVASIYIQAPLGEQEAYTSVSELSHNYVSAIYGYESDEDDIYISTQRLNAISKMTEKMETLDINPLMTIQIEGPTSLQNHLRDIVTEYNDIYSTSKSRHRQNFLRSY